MKRVISQLFLCLALLLGTVGMVSAQTATGNLYVRAVDNEGAPLPGVTVTMTGAGAPRVQVTDGNGQTRFLAIDPGNVQLTSELEGFSTIEYPNVNIRVGLNTTIELSMSPAVEETITVTSESPLLDERKLTTGTTISQVELEKIPTARDPWSVLSQTPGVMVDRINVGGNESGQQSTFTGPGVGDDENAFLIDGVETTDMAAVGASATYYDFDQFTEMQFTTGGTDVTKSNAGVSVNLVTKRGTNEFRGSARFLRTDDNFFNGALEQNVPDFNASSGILGGGNVGNTQNLPDGSPQGAPQTRFIGNTINQVQEYGFEAGGPAVKDKLWFWGSFGSNDIKNRTGAASPDAVQADDTILENTALKINGQLGSSNSFTGSWNNGDKKKFGRNAGPTRPQPTTWDQRGPSAIIKFEDTHVVNSNFFIGGTLSKVDGGFSLTSKAVIAAGSITAAPETTWAAEGWGNSYLSGSSSRPSEEVKIDGSYFFNTGNAGHEIKFGARQRDFDQRSDFLWPGRDLFHINENFFGVPQTVHFRGIDGPPVTTSYQSAWIQDTISTGNLTINVGLRYDLQDGRNEAASVPAAVEVPDVLPAFSYPGAAAPFEWSTITPRVGVTYALGEERKTLLRGSFSQFPEQLSTANINRTNPAGRAYATFIFDDVNGNGIWDDFNESPLTFDGNVGFDPSDPTSIESVNVTDPGLDPSMINELIVGVEHAFAPEFVAGATVTLRETDDILGTRQMIDLGNGPRPSTAADYELAGTLEGILPDGTPYSAPYYSLPAGSRTGGQLLENTDRSVEYEGISVNFTKRLSNQWMLRGYFTSGEGTYSLGSSYIANYDPTDEEGGFDNEGGLFAVQAAGSGAKQDVFLESGFQFNLNGMYQVAPDQPWGFNIAGNLYSREGTPLPYYDNVRPADAFAKDVQVTTALDSFRAPDITTFDLRLEKEFASTGNVGFSASIDVFNVLDETTVLQRRRRLDASTADNLTETLSPRIYRFGVRVNWR